MTEEKDVNELIASDPSIKASPYAQFDLKVTLVIPGKGKFDQFASNRYCRNFAEMFGNLRSRLDEIQKIFDETLGVVLPESNDRSG